MANVTFSSPNAAAPDGASPPLPADATASAAQVVLTVTVSHCPVAEQQEPCVCVCVFFPVCCSVMWGRVGGRANEAELFI